MSPPHLRVVQKEDRVDMTPVMPAGPMPPVSTWILECTSFKAGIHMSHFRSGLRLAGPCDQLYGACQINPVSLTIFLVVYQASSSSSSTSLAHQREAVPVVGLHGEADLDAEGRGKCLEYLIEEWGSALKHAAGAHAGIAVGVLVWVR